MKSVGGFQNNLFLFYPFISGFTSDVKKKMEENGEYISRKNKKKFIPESEAEEWETVSRRCNSAKML